MTLRVNEIYTSFQGEGPNVGAPTVFVRFVGCNLKCPGWPCDSQHAIDPKLYRKDMVSYGTADAFAAAVIQEWRPGRNICFTGGEVTLQPIEDLERALNLVKHHTGTDFELFTNGTRWWPEGFRGYFNTIILDWKLPGSGEVISGDQAMHLDRNIHRLRPTDAIKFTVTGDSDFEEAATRYRALEKEYDGIGLPQVYCGPVWGAIEAEVVAGWILDAGMPWFLNVQTHKYVWDPDKRRI